MFKVPLRRLLALIDLAEKRLAKEQALFMTGVRAAVWAEVKAFKQLLKDLDNG